jgi:hypothetical protein
VVNALDTKLARYLWRLRGQVLAIAVVLAAAAICALVTRRVLALDLERVLKARE